MKFLVPTLAALLLVGCNSNMVRHQKDYRPGGAKGPWTDYYKATKMGEPYVPPTPKKKQQ